MLVIIEREKLYEEVWNIKMKDLAKTYGISEVSLRKYCRKLNVPFPQRGYWTKVRNGSNPKKMSLPEFDGDNKIVIEKHEHNKKNSYTEDSKLKHMAEEEKKKVLEFCNNIKVPKNLYKPHTLIKETKIYNDKRDMIRDGRANNLNLKVSNELKNRALRLMDTIFKSVEKLGFKIESRNRDTIICIADEEVKIGLKEKLIRFEHIKTNKDSYWSPIYDYKYSGELTLFIDYYDAPRKNWKDLNSNKVEDMVGEFIIAIIDTAEILRIKHEKTKIEAEIRRQKEIEKMNLKKKEDYQLKKIQELKECAENYIVSTRINEYINALEKELTNVIDKDKRIKISKYIDWARRKSEWINPIIQKEDEILGKKYDDKLYDVDFQDDEDYSWI
jgi:hypothetical protein